MERDDVAAAVHHVGVRVVDLERSLAFYGALGLTSVGSIRFSDTYYVAFLAGGSGREPFLELVVNSDPPADYSRAPGSGHFALVVDDLDAVIGVLAEEGWAPESEPFLADGRPGIRVCFITDPDGHRIELVDHRFDLPHDELPSAGDEE